LSIQQTMALGLVALVSVSHLLKKCQCGQFSSRMSQIFTISIFFLVPVGNVYETVCFKMPYTFASPGSISGGVAKPKSFLEIQQEQESDPHQLQPSSSAPLQHSSQPSLQPHTQPSVSAKQLGPSKSKVSLSACEMLFSFR